MKRARGSVVIAAMVGLFLSLPLEALAQAKGPIKIGGLFELTGVFSGNARESLDGTRMFFDEIGWKVAGRTIELLVEDTEGKPDVALTKARKLVERDGVHMLMGIVSSPVCLAVQGYAKEKMIPVIISADCGFTGLTMPGKFLNPYVFRWSQTGIGPGAPAADWAYKDAKWRKVASVASDYPAGIEVNAIFARVFCELGGRVTSEVYPPIGTADFAPFLGRVDRSADAVIFFGPGADGLRFGRQYAEYGLKEKLPLMDLYGQVAFEPNLSAPDAAGWALGVYSAIHYTAALDTPENKKFVPEFRRRYNHLPFDNGPDGYVGGKAIAEAAKVVNGNVEDKEKFMAAMRKLDFDSPKGRVHLDQFQNVVQSQYIRKVERVGGELMNVPIKAYHSLSQFWTWTPEEFLKYPTLADLKGKMTDCKQVLGK